ncbi:MAG: metallophosphoesterase family protein [Candidatus Heimdallarchaeota archaeon]
MRKITKKIEYRFCHTADWHLDYLQYNKKERWEDFFQAANDCIKQIVKEKPDFVIHCGDLFHQFKPLPGAIRQTLAILEKLKEAEIPFYVIRGNHDASKAQAQRYGGTILKLLDDFGYMNYVQDERVAINEHISFFGLGEYGKATGTILEEVLRNYPIEEKKYNILALHGYIQGQVSDNLYDLTGYELASRGFNYIALGHYHKKWAEPANNLYCPGSTEQTSLNDWGKPDEDGYFRKSSYLSSKITYNEETEEWNTKVSRKYIDVRPKGRFKLIFDPNLSIEEIHIQANDFVKRHDLEGAIVKYDFEGILPLGKQGLVNLTNIEALRNSKALHYMVSQNFTAKSALQAKTGLTQDEAIIELLQKKYDLKKQEANNWFDLTSDAIRTLSTKSITKDNAEEIQLIYDAISKKAKELTIFDSKGKKPEVKVKQTTKSKEVQKKDPPLKTNKTISKNTTQADLAKFFSEGD